MLENIRTDFEVYLGQLDRYAKTGDENKFYNIINYKNSIENQIKLLHKDLRGWVSEVEAIAILGRSFFGPNQIGVAFEIHIPPEQIPAIPFSVEDLERAKELGQSLILRTDTAPDGTPLTMQKMNELLEESFKKKNEKVLYDNPWYTNEDFYTKDTPKVGWVLVSKEIIPDSTNKNYLEQTQSIVDYLVDTVFANQEIPEIYREAVEEYDNQLSELTKLMNSDWQEAAKRLSELKITKLNRQSPADAIYDLMVYKQNNDERLLENKYTWTLALSTVGGLVRVGGFGSGGAFVGNDRPDDSDDYLGAVFVRSQ